MTGEACPTVDWSALAQRYRSRPSAIDRLVGIAIETNRDTAVTLRALAQAGDADAIRPIAHGLAGGAHAIAAYPVADLATRVDAACRLAAPEAFVLARELAAGVDSLLAELLRHRSAHGGPASSPSR